MCYQEFYVTATTLTDVGVWLTCENMALGVVLPAFYGENAYVDSNTDAISQKCNFCSDAPYPPVALAVQVTNPQHVMGIKTIKTVLDWSGKLYNVQGLGLRKAIEAIIVWQVTKNVKKGAILGAKSLVDTQITRGYVQPNTTLSTRDTPSNTTDPAFQYMNSSIDITATFQMVAFEPNYTYADLQTELDGVLQSANFSSLLANINANITEQSFSTTVLSQATTTGAVATDTSATSSTGTVAGTSTQGAATPTSTQKSAAVKRVRFCVGSWSLLVCSMFMAIL
jgi:hypothetical protein